MKKHTQFLLILAVLLMAISACTPVIVTPEAGTIEEESVPERQGTYEDPLGRFSVPIPTNWTVQEMAEYITLASPEGDLVVHILTVAGADAEAAIADAWSIVDPDFALEIDETIEVPPAAAGGVDKFVVVSYERDDDDPIIQAEGREVGDTVHVLLFNMELSAAQRRMAQLQIIDTGYTISALAVTDLRGVEPLPLSGELIAELEAYIVAKMEQFDTPGAAIAIIKEGELVYANGFGVRSLHSNEPVTPETLMMVGSTGKSMTTMLMAQLVDEGVFAWNTRAVDILPTFKVADLAITEQITMRNLVCACTGVPRRDFEMIFNAQEMSAEDVVESLAGFEFFTDIGEAFQYSNQMVATGGYLATLAAGGTYGTLYDDYLGLMQERVLDPIGMGASTFSFDTVLANGDYAMPYSRLPTGEMVELPLSYEEFVKPVAPAGGLWSNVLDMANYVTIELNEGIAPDGTRVVSAQNLAVTWEPQIEISADASYGLGWIVEDYDGLLVLSHGGNTFGFTSELAFVPELNLGISILTNQQGSPVNTVTRVRLLELLFDRESEVEEIVQFQQKSIEKSRAELLESLQEGIDPALAEEFAGTYTNDGLGDMIITWEDEALFMDVGELKAEIRARENDDGEIEYFTFSPPLSGIPLEFKKDDDGDPVLVFGVGVVEYTLERVK